MTKSFLIVLLASAALAGCKRGGDSGPGAVPPGAPGSIAAPAFGADSERTWVGLLPCSDCQGVDTRLVLRSKNGRRSYLMTETYLGAIGSNSFDSAGTWNETIDQASGQIIYILDPARAEQRFALQPDGALEALDGNGNAPQQAVAFRLQRL